MKRRSRPRQHKRRLRSGRVITVNRGVKRKAKRRQLDARSLSAKDVKASINLAPKPFENYMYRGHKIEIFGGTVKVDGKRVGFDMFDPVQIAQNYVDRQELPTSKVVGAAAKMQPELEIPLKVVDGRLEFVIPEHKKPDLEVKLPVVAKPSVPGPVVSKHAGAMSYGVWPSIKKDGWAMDVWKGPPVKRSKKLPWD